MGKITSRLGCKAEAFAFNRTYDILRHIEREHDKEKVSCVFVDEAQFLTKEQVLQLTIVTDRVGIPVVCYGLRTDFQGEPFEGSTYLMAWAEQLTEIKAVCGCGRKATMNARIGADGKRVTEGEQICIGHHYRAMARKCFQLHKVTKIKYDYEGFCGKSVSPPVEKKKYSRSTCEKEMDACVRALSLSSGCCDDDLKLVDDVGVSDDVVYVCK